jgi:organic radical activating enzyme
MNEITREAHEKYIATHPPYITIYPTDHCSHHCWYCCSHEGNRNPVKSVIDEMGWHSFINRILKLSNGIPCEYRISGGEPLEHPATLLIIERLLENGHTVCLGTNGVHIEHLQRLQGKIKFETSFHLGQYLKEPTRGRADDWIDVYLPQMLNHASGIGIVIPMTLDVLYHPDTESYLDRIEEKLKPYNFPSHAFSFTELYGNFNGRTMPRDYTEADRNRIVELIHKYLDPEYKRTIDELSTINKSLKLKGVPCYYMSRMLQINSIGDVIVCGAGLPDKKMGNIKSDTLNVKITDEPQPCEFESCGCPPMAYSACLEPHGMTFEDYNKIGNENPGN